MLLDQSQITPGRSTRLFVDIPDPVLADPAITWRREGPQIGTDLLSGASDESRLSNMRFWPSGCWTLDTIQSQITNIHEYIDTAHLIIPAGGFQLIKLVTGNAMIEVINHWRVASDLPGMIFNAALIAATGDPWMVRHVPSGSDVSGTAVGTSTPIPGGIAIDIPLDRCGESIDKYDQDQGFFLRWTLPGTGKHHPNFVWAFYFGQYCVAIKGSGQCDLYEYCHDINGALQWRKRDTFRYCRPSQISDASHTLLVWPHTGASGEKFIAFGGMQPDAAAFISGFSTNDPSQVAPTAHTYRMDETRRNGDVDESPGHATKSDVIRFDMRRDLLKLEIQISTLGFWENGYLLDQPVEIPWYSVSTAQNLKLDLRSDQTATTSITTTILDADTPDHMDPFNAATTQHPYVKFAFAGDGKGTPKLWSYLLTRPQTIQAGSGPSWQAHVMAASVSGFAGDGSEQSANVNVQDVAGTMTILSRRGRFPAVLSTLFQPPAGGDPVWVPLLRGYIYRPQGELKGNRSAGLAYPSADWAEYALPMVGMNLRLNERFNISEVVAYVEDFDAPGDPVFGIHPPWLVTAAVRDLLGRAGFPPGMINIPDVPVRLWFGLKDASGGLISNPMTTFGEMAARLVRDYLGAYLFFDETAGDAGQWTIIFGQQINPVATPLYNFVRGTAGLMKLPHSPGSYPPLTTWVNTSIKSQPVPPEFNSVHIVCPASKLDKNTQVQVGNYMANPKSFPVPGMTTVPDPNSPDYFGGYEKRLTIVELGCQARGDQNGTAIQRTMDNVNWKCRRYYDFLCHGQVSFAIEAPLVCIQDAITNRWRPLRFMDLVAYDGSNTLIRSCSPRYTQDSQQMALYEIIQVTT